MIVHSLSPSIHLIRRDMVNLDRARPWKVGQLAFPKGRFGCKNDDDGDDESLEHHVIGATYTASLK